MAEFIKCNGVIDNRDIVNCPIKNKCKRFNIKSIGFEQRYLIPEVVNEKCLNYLEDENKENSKGIQRRPSKRIK